MTTSDIKLPSSQIQTHTFAKSLGRIQKLILDKFCSVSWSLRVLYYAWKFWRKQRFGDWQCNPEMAQSYQHKSLGQHKFQSGVRTGRGQNCGQVGREWEARLELAVMSYPSLCPWTCDWMGFFFWMGLHSCGSARFAVWDALVLNLSVLVTAVA